MHVNQGFHAADSAFANLSERVESGFAAADTKFDELKSTTEHNGRLLERVVGHLGIGD